MTWIALLASLLLGLGSLAWTFSQAGQAPVAWGLLALGVSWLYAARRNWAWFSTAGFFATLGLAAYGLWLDYPTGWMMAGALGGLAAWDLSFFLRRIRSVPPSAEVRALQRNHLTRLAIVMLFGLALASLALAIRLELTFEWLAVLVVVAFLGLSQLIAWIRKGGE